MRLVSTHKQKPLVSTLSEMCLIFQLFYIGLDDQISAFEFGLLILNMHSKTLAFDSTVWEDCGLITTQPVIILKACLKRLIKPFKILNNRTVFKSYAVKPTVPRKNENCFFGAFCWETKKIFSTTTMIFVININTGFCFERGLA